MSTSTVSDSAWAAFPWTWRNNRGCAMVNGRFLRYGIPEPAGNKEPDDALKGADRIGFSPLVITADMVGSTVAVFTSIEIKGHGDRLKEGQRRWHSFVIEHGGRSEIWKENADGSVEIIKEKIE